MNMSGSFLHAVKLQGLNEFRVVVVLLLLGVIVLMWCFYLPVHLTKFFAKQLLHENFPGFPVFSRNSPDFLHF